MRFQLEETIKKLNYILYSFYIEILFNIILRFCLNDLSMLLQLLFLHHLPAFIGKMIIQTPSFSTMIMVLFLLFSHVYSIIQLILLIPYFSCSPFFSVNLNKLASPHWQLSKHFSFQGCFQVSFFESNNISSIESFWLISNQ